MRRIGAPESRIMLGWIIKNAGLDLNGTGCEAIDLPGVRTKQQPNTVKAEGNVRAFPQSDQASRAHGQFLTSNSQRNEGVLSRSQQQEVSKSLVHVQFVFVNDWAWAAGSAVFQRTVEFAKEAKPLARVEVSVKQVALQKVSIRILRREAKIGVVEMFVGLADIASQRE